MNKSQQKRQTFGTVEAFIGVPRPRIVCMCESIGDDERKFMVQEKNYGGEAYLQSCCCLSDQVLARDDICMGEVLCCFHFSRGWVPSCGHLPPAIQSIGHAGTVVPTQGHDCQLFPAPPWMQNGPESQILFGITVYSLKRKKTAR